MKFLMINEENMKDKIFVDELAQHINQEIISYFLVTEKELRRGANNLFIRLKLSDKTGDIRGNIWNNAKHIDRKFEKGDFVKIKGVVISYKSQTQLTVNKIKSIAPENLDITQFIESTSKDLNELADKLFEYIENMKNQYLRNLLKIIFDDKEFFNAFMEAPAAKNWHHNYVGGLLEHTIAVATICEFAAMQYKVDKDLLISGALLHDIGKVHEYSLKPIIEFTPVGRLVGHIPIADHFVSDKAKEINKFPPKLLMKLRHLILSHHGEYEYASARLPQTIEAIVLHYADNLDAQTVGVQQMIDQVQTNDAEWTEFDKLNNLYYYIK